MSKKEKRIHPQFSNSQLKNLSLADLLSGIEPQALAQKALGGPEAKKLDIRTRETQEAEQREAREREIARAAQRAALSPWRPEAVILLMLRVECDCGASFESPASQSLMTRFRHSRNNSIWEVAFHPCQQNPSLPREIKYLPQRVLACPHCFTEGLQHYSELFLQGGLS